MNKLHLSRLLMLLLSCGFHGCVPFRSALRSTGELLMQSTLFTGKFGRALFQPALELLHLGQARLDGLQFLLLIF